MPPSGGISLNQGDNMKIHSNTIIQLPDGTGVPLIELVRMYKVFVKSEEKLSTVDELRKKRAKECFPIVDRGELWYNNLTDEQYKELKDWRQAWLDVTETMIIPTAPKWINDKLEGDEIL